MIDGRWKRKRRKLAQQVYHPDKDWPEKVVLLQSLSNNHTKSSIGDAITHNYQD